MLSHQEHTVSQVVKTVRETIGEKLPEPSISRLAGRSTYVAWVIRDDDMRMTCVLEVYVDRLGMLTWYFHAIDKKCGSDDAVWSLPTSVTDTLKEYVK